MADTGIKKDSKFYVCETPQASDLANAAAFEALTWVEVERIVTLPDFGFTQNTPSQDYVNTDMSQFKKGFKQGSSSDLVFGWDTEAATGQAALKLIVDSPLNYALKMELDDAPSSSDTNTIMYSRGIAAGWNFTGGGGEDFDNVTTNITLNQAPIIVPSEAI